MDKLKTLRGKLLGALGNECSKWDILCMVCLAVKKYSMMSKASPRFAERHVA